MPKPALLIVDVINHFAFAGARALATAADAIGAPLRALRDRFDAAGLPVIYANDNWTDWQGGFPDLVASSLALGGASAHLAERLAPEDGHYYVLKPKHSAFMATALPVLLQQLDVDRIAITGIATDSCVLATAIDAHMRDYRLWVPGDCTAARTPALKRAALHVLRHTCHADVGPGRGNPFGLPGGGTAARRTRAVRSAPA
jgi:nicotinamidase-related amidase